MRSDLGGRLPKALAKDMNLDLGSAVEVRSNGQEIVIRRASVRYSLDDMVSQITESNRHGEYEINPVRGKEAWEKAGPDYFTAYLQ
ncbi:MAG: AbrB/MazE/SpoVT family DNA-binding domain-containing protein [Bacillota bacterium]|nr:AbrB/MazE/SpoVT family DNA-binding domain-containing protein [Bacillota bacterium]